VSPDESVAAAIRDQIETRYRDIKLRNLGEDVPSLLRGTARLEQKPWYVYLEQPDFVASPRTIGAGDYHLRQREQRQLPEPVNRGTVKETRLDHVGTRIGHDVFGPPLGQPFARRDERPDDHVPSLNAATLAAGYPR
jgi:hypothetical protein